MAKASKSSASEHVELEGYEGHFEDFGPYTVGFETYTADADLAPLFVGLPDDRCQCPHMGYVVKGKVKFTFADGTEETYEAGDAYYAPPRSPPDALCRNRSRRVQPDGGTPARRWRSSKRTWRPPEPSSARIRRLSGSRGERRHAAGGSRPRRRGGAGALRRAPGEARPALEVGGADDAGRADDRRRLLDDARRPEHAARPSSRRTRSASSSCCCCCGSRARGSST